MAHSDSTVSMSFIMKDEGGGVMKMTASVADLRKVIKATVQEADRLKKPFINFAALATGIDSVNNTLTSMQEVLQNLTADYKSFDESMKAANTMAGKDAAGFDQLKSSISDLSKTIPIARDELANGLYQVVSNGVPEDNWIKFLETSARSAVGGIADLGKTVTVTSTIIKNYGLEWNAAQEIQDKIQLTAKNGVTSFEQLSQALPRVAGNAATLGVSVDELMASFATLTGVSGNTAEVSTQLAAIFTALVKPASQATKMAEEMGIQFDAAAIKAAGGFNEFLQQLDRSIKAYANANGMLEQEIYASLFGSAESLRALIPLTGELSDKFISNIGAMTDSAGTMDDAFAEMSSTGSATAQKLKNQWAAATDFIAEILSDAQPYISFVANTTIALGGIVKLTRGIQTATVAVKGWHVGTKLLNVAMVLSTGSVKKGAQAMRRYAVAAKGSAAATTAFKTALRGLMSATAIGLAITALTAVIEHFMNAADDAADATDNLTDANKRAQRDAERLEELHQAETSALESSRAALTLNITKLRDFNGTKEQEKKLVSEMNDTYGDTMGYFSSVASWYQALIGNSEAYCRQMVIEARTRTLANQIAQKEQERHDLIYNKDGSIKRYKVQVRSALYKNNGEKVGEFPESLNKKEKEAQRAMSVAEIEKANADAKKNAAAWGGMGTYVQLIPSDWQKFKASRDSVEADIKGLNAQLKSVAEEASKIDFKVKGSPERPESPEPPKDPKDPKEPIGPKNDPVFKADASNLKEMGDNIRVLDQMLQTATEEEAALINASIAKWEERADAIRNAGKETGPVFKADASNVKEMEDNIKALQLRLDGASTEEEGALINGSIARWQEKADAIRNAGKETTEAFEWHDAPQNIKEIDDNIRKLQNDLQTASKGDAAGINGQIDRLQELRATYENAGREAEVTFDTFRDGWGAIKNLSGGIDSITQALEGNGNAWQKVTGIVDGFIQICDSLKAIVEIINMLSSAAKSHTAAKEAEAITTAAATVATTADTAATEANTIAATANTAAKSGEAVAEATSSGAKLPFPMNLAAIAAGVAAVVGALAIVGSFATGGIVGGNSPNGDKLLVRVNSGEMILNRGQQQRLFALLNSAAPFANGGIVSGPTVGLIGEYPGASHNPEVVAPLDRLWKLIRPAGAPVIIGGTLRASGREIVVALANETRIAGKSGKRTNIRI
ncbi:MAG: phage tail tape measure protein [Bacteroidales bacterium]|nr:phage tail tape measure protein [Bacteroidales bacterium]